MPFNFVEFMRRELPQRPLAALPEFEPPFVTPLRKPLAQSTVGLFTSGGVQHRSDPPLGETNDLSYRLVHRDWAFSDLLQLHMTPVRVFAQEDLNVIYPRDPLVQLEREGTISRFAPWTVSMVGSITRYTELMTETLPKIEEEFDRQDVDLVLLVPM